VKAVITPYNINGGAGAPGVGSHVSGSVLLDLLHAVVGDVQLKDDAVVDQAVDGGCRGHRILDDALPLEKGRLLVSSTLQRSYRSASRVNRTSISLGSAARSPSRR